MTLPGAQVTLTLRSLAPAYCASRTLCANATVLRIRARNSPIVSSVSSCVGGDLAGKARGGEFHVVTGDLHLLDERVLAGCKAAGDEYANVILLGRRILLSFVQQGLEVLQRLGTLSDHVVEHMLHGPRGGFWPARNQSEGTYRALHLWIDLPVRF